MDIIFLNDFKVETLIGYYDWERTRPQAILLDLDIGIPDQQASQSDDIHDTIHYGEVASAITQSLKDQQFQLIEALAEHIANLLLNDFGAPWVRVRLSKPGILANVKKVGIVIERRASTNN